MNIEKRKNMKYEYSPDRLQKKYEDESIMKKKYGIEISTNMMKFLNALEAAENAYDIKCMPQFFMEHKKGNLNSYYSISLDKKKSKWRLMIQMLDKDGNVVFPTENEKEFLLGIKKIRIKELSEHYGEY